jgi:hypothetical protein
MRDILVLLAIVLTGAHFFNKHSGGPVPLEVKAAGSPDCPPGAKQDPHTKTACQGPRDTKGNERSSAP